MRTVRVAQSTQPKKGNTIAIATPAMATLRVCFASTRPKPTARCHSKLPRVGSAPTRGPVFSLRVDLPKLNGPVIVPRISMDRYVNFGSIPNCLLEYWTLLETNLFYSFLMFWLFLLYSTVNSSRAMFPEIGRGSTLILRPEEFRKPTAKAGSMLQYGSLLL